MIRSTILVISLLVFQQETLLAQVSFDSEIKEAKTSIISLIKEENIVGLSITVSFEDAIIWSEGFGYADLEGKRAIKPNETLFRIASLAKPITATIFGRLIEEKIIDYTNSVYKYVPTFPKKKFDINLEHLANHTSGIRHYKTFEKENREPLSIEQGLTLFEKSKLKFKPGTDYLYSSYGYNLLGVAMEKASEMSFEELMEKYITQPLEMVNTIADKGIYDGIQISGFFKSNGKGKIAEAKPAYMATKLPSGGMLSTSEDLVAFGNAYAQNSLLKSSTQIKVLTETQLPNGKKTGYGIGWGIKVDAKGRKVISHTGGNSGSVCRLIVYPDSKLTIAVVSNTYGIDWLKFIRTVNHIPNIFLD